VRCSHCQTENPQGASFCAGCGQALPVAPVAPVAAAPRFCPNCGAPAAPGISYCASCGAALAGAPGIPGGAGGGYAAAGVEYAGFWLRFGAYLLDGLILAAIILIPIFIVAAIGASQGLKNVDGTTKLPTWAAGLIVVLYVASFFVQWLYFAMQESGPRQATLGKRACGIIVTDMQGERLSFGRATGRYFAKIISTLTLTIGYIMAGFTEHKQALHDMIASTLVVRGKRP
jgi:uncharacterized RDD family membrane protein YckC